MKPCEQNCKKCGSSNIYKRLRPAGYRLTYYDKEDGRFLSTDKTVTEEHIANTCRCCGFFWTSYVLGKCKHDMQLWFPDMSSGRCIDCGVILHKDKLPG